METVDCVRNLEEAIRASAQQGTLTTGAFAQWSNEAPIHILGRVLTKGMWPRWCIRWATPAYSNRGLFGKGLACYDGPPLQLGPIAHLPITR